jgi:hypothetical protein
MLSGIGLIGAFRLGGVKPATRPWETFPKGDAGRSPACGVAGSET